MTRADTGSHRRQAWDGEDDGGAPGWDSARWREERRAGAAARRSGSGRRSAFGVEQESRSGYGGQGAAPGAGGESDDGGDGLYRREARHRDAAGYPSGGDGATGYEGTGYDLAGYDQAGYDGSPYNGSTYNGSTYNGSTYNGSPYNGSSYGGSGYDPASYGSAGYDRAGYDPATYEGSSYEGSSYDGASYEGSSYGGSSHGRAAYDGASYEGSTYDGSSHGRAAYDGASYEGSSYDRASYGGDSRTDLEPGYSRTSRAEGGSAYRSATGSISVDERPVGVDQTRSRRRREQRDDGGRDGDGAGKSSSPVMPFVGAVGEVVIVVAMALTLALVIKTLLVQAFFIPSASMENTLLRGDRVLVSKLTPGPFDLHRGDVVVFKDPGGWLQPVSPPQDGAMRRVVRDALTFVGLLPQDSGEHLIKRVIGLPGDTVTCCDAQGRLQVNGVSINEPYLFPGNVPSATTFSVKVPAGNLWVMGDHRAVSEDSRFHRGLYDGTVPMKDVVGKAFVVVWPLDRAGTLGAPSSVFAGVPGASGVS